MTAQRNSIRVDVPANPNRTKRLWSAECVSRCRFKVDERTGGVQPQVAEHLQKFPDHLVQVTMRRTSFQAGKEWDRL